MDENQEVVFCRMGRMEYEECWSLQQRLQARLIQNKRSDAPQDIPHVCLLVEHPPVFTLGKSGDESNLIASKEDLEAAGATFVKIDRGGDITYHGPGQIVGYPILDLDRFYTDIHRYLRDLEEVIIRTCHSFNIEAGRFDGKTGVWITEPVGSERKICAMGIRCSRWVTMHGFALNVATEIDHFSMIVPCGIQDRGVTSMEMELLQQLDKRAVESEIAEKFAEVFRVRAQMLEYDDAQSFLTTYLD
ncbi:lipoyl(octanoyl) transferase LipB [bacterium]|nr:lipoyl(octanoyl) transferase LipB [bacterium]